jgi:hypothetical protein
VREAGCVNPGWEVSPWRRALSNLAGTEFDAVETGERISSNMFDRSGLKVL